MNFVIEYPKYRLYLRIRWPDDEVEQEQEERSYGAPEFIHDFQELGRKVGAPTRGVSGEDYGIAVNLLRKHDREHLLEVARLFWSLFSEPVFDHPNVHLMRLFASRILDIERVM